MHSNNKINKKFAELTGTIVKKKMSSKINYQGAMDENSDSESAQVSSPPRKVASKKKDRCEKIQKRSKDTKQHEHKMKSSGLKKIKKVPVPVVEEDDESEDESFKVDGDEDDDDDDAEEEEEEVEVSVEDEEEEDDEESVDGDVSQSIGDEDEDDDDVVGDTVANSDEDDDEEVDNEEEEDILSPVKSSKSEKNKYKEKIKEKEKRKKDSVDTPKKNKVSKASKSSPPFPVKAAVTKRKTSPLKPKPVAAPAEETLEARKYEIPSTDDVCELLKLSENFRESIISGVDMSEESLRKLGELHHVIALIIWEHTHNLMCKSNMTRDPNRAYALNPPLNKTYSKKSYNIPTMLLALMYSSAVRVDATPRMLETEFDGLFCVAPLMSGISNTGKRKHKSHYVVECELNPALVYLQICAYEYNSAMPSLNEFLEAWERDDGIDLAFLTPWPAAKKQIMDGSQLTAKTMRFLISHEQIKTIKAFHCAVLALHSLTLPSLVVNSESTGFTPNSAFEEIEQFVNIARTGGIRLFR